MKRCLILIGLSLLSGLSASAAVDWIRDFTVDGKRVRLAPGETRIDFAKIYPADIVKGREGTRWATIEAKVECAAEGREKLHVDQDWFGSFALNGKLLVKSVEGNRPLKVWLKKGVNTLTFRSRGGVSGHWYFGAGFEGLRQSGEPPPMADFSVARGKIRPELHSSGFGPTICSQTAQDLADLKAMGFKAARTHDWALINPNERVCDWHHIFPLVHLDATKPENYVFGPTDYLLKRTREEMGADVFFRLGTSIEHSGERVHFNALVPQDFDKTAEVFAGTVRHYNRGWANGHRWGIRYWEIWNEPEGSTNMWCPPEGTEGLTPDEQHAACERLRAQFLTFFVTCLKRLKSEFGDEIKVGGPALCSANEDWMGDILRACRAAGVAPDFISWHGYSDDPSCYNVGAEKMRALCRKYGFDRTELIVNEWHYFGYGDYSWADMQRCSDPEVKARIWEGPDSHNGITSSAFTLAALANIQRSKLDQAYYYGCRHTGSWGFKDDLQKKYKVFYALKLFGDIVKNYETICESTSAATVTTFAVRNAAGKRALLVADYDGTGPKIEIDVKGVPEAARPTCTVLSHGLDLAAWTDLTFDGSRLVLKKPDPHSACFFVEF